MRSFSNWLRLALLATVALTSACGSLPLFSKGGAGETSQPSADSRSAAAASIAKRSAPLQVASTGDYAPFTTIDAQGVRSGLDVEVAERFAHDLGAPLAWLPLTWSNLDAATASGSFDVAMSGVTLRADRALLGRFTRPLATTGAVAIVRAASARRFAAPEALDQPGVRLAVNAGGHLERLARERFRRATVLPQASNADVPLALRDGRADAAISDTAEAHLWLSADFVALPPFSVDHKGALLPVDRAELATQLDTWLRAREADGWLNAARVRWLGPGASLDAAAAAREAVAALIQLRLDLMPSIAAAKRAAGQPIEDPAQEARVLERVRAAVPADPARAEAVYKLLFAMAKQAQRDAAPVDVPPSLEVLRAALGRIDETLCAELEQLPASAADSWFTTLTRTLGRSADVYRLGATLGVAGSWWTDTPDQ